MALQRIALISDLHGNLPALTATLADIARRGIERIICLGDLVGKGPDGARVVDICRARCEQVVRGNWDEALATATRTADPFAWQQKQLGPDRLAYLGSLPNTVELRLSGQRIRLLHASPQGVNHRVFAEAPPPVLRAMFAPTPFTGPGGADVVGYGDIHEPFLRTFGAQTLFNAGSVGNPLDLPLAAYAVLEGEADETPGPLTIGIVRLPYDIEQAIADARRVGMPDGDRYAIELRTAVYQGRVTIPESVTPLAPEAGPDD